jgi:hypothetical protein
MRKVDSPNTMSWLGAAYHLLTSAWRKKTAWALFGDSVAPLLPSWGDLLPNSNKCWLCLHSSLCKSLHKRKNWIQVGSVQAGPRVAAILSVVESCRRLKIPVREYLADILPGLANTPSSVSLISLLQPGPPDTLLPIVKLATAPISTACLARRLPPKNGLQFQS